MTPVVEVYNHGKVRATGGIESVECSTGMEWWNGIVEWPHFSHLEGNEASLGHIMCLNSIVLHTDSSQGSSSLSYNFYRGGKWGLSKLLRKTGG